MKEHLKKEITEALAIIEKEFGPLTPPPIEVVEPIMQHPIEVVEPVENIEKEVSLTL